MVRLAMHGLGPMQQVILIPARGLPGPQCESRNFIRSHVLFSSSMIKYVVKHIRGETSEQKGMKFRMISFKVP